MDLQIVYPPMGGDHGGIRLFESLEQIPDRMTGAAGYRCYTITIPTREQINSGVEFTALSSPREMLKGLDRERFSTFGGMADAGTTAGSEQHPAQTEGEANIVVLYSPVSGIPPTHCHLISNPDDPLLFRVAAAVDVKELRLGQRHVNFNPPITLQPDLYTLDPELKPTLWQAPGKMAAG